MSDICLYFIAFFLPPVAVFIKRGCGGALLLNLILDCLGWIPGVLREFEAGTLPGTCVAVNIEHRDIDR